MSSRAVCLAACCLVIWFAGCGGTSPAKPQSDSTAAKGKLATVDQPLEKVPANDPSASKKTAAANEAFSKLVNASEDSNPDEWTQAEAALLALGADAVPALAGHLSDPNPFSRELAAQFLAQLGPAAAGAERQLVKSLTDDSSLVKMNAAAALLSMNSSAKEIAPALQSLLTDPDQSIRLPAAISLAGFDANTDEAVATLTDLLSAPNGSVRLGAVEALGRLGDKALSSRPAVRRLADDDSPEVRTAAATALKRIETGESSDSKTIPASGVEP